MKKLLALFALMLACVGQTAYGFMVDGIAYTPSGKNAIVTYKTTNYNSYNGSITIPSTVTYNNVTYNVTSIGEKAFYGCIDLKSISLPNTITSIGANAFYNCHDMTSFTIPNSVTTIGNNAFQDCDGLSSIIVSDKLIKIGDYAFKNCSRLQSFTIPKGVTSIGNYAFQGCALTSICIPEGVTSIGTGAFRNCSGLTSITIPNSVTSIGSEAVAHCGLTSIVLGNSIKNVNTGIGINYCSSLRSIVFGSSVTSITGSQLPSCTIYITCLSETPPETSDEVWSAYGILHVCEGCKAAYEAHPVWRKFEIVEDRHNPNSYTHQTYKAATCTNEGNIEYWYCSDCQRYFSEEEGIQEIERSKVIIPSLGHDLIYTDNEDGTHHVVCSRCSYVKDEEHTYNDIECTLCGAKAPRTCSFDFSAPSSLGITPSDEVDGDVEVTEPITNGQLTLTADNAVEVTFDGPEYKLEVGRAGTLEIAAKSPDIIKKIEFGVGSDIEQVTANCGILDGLAWTGEAGSVTFSVEDVRNAFAQFTTITVWYESNTWEIEDGQPYTVSENVEHQAVNYTRNFSSTNWQALYVPFSMKYDDWKDKLDVYDIYNVLAYDEDNNGEIERTTVNMIRLKEGAVTEPNCPYVVRAKNAGDVEITLTDGTLYAAEENSIDCTSTKQKFTFTGTYEPMTGLATKGYYALSGGELKTAIDDAVTLKPQRWYMEVTNRNGSPAAATRVYLNPFGEENEVEGVKGVAVNIIGEETTYDLNGRAVNAAQLPKGLYVRGGKKIIVK